MSNSYFQFKKFIVHHANCAMKVGTDGVLLGAWVPLDRYKDILDVGTGTGLIALQLAQRKEDAHIVAIEVDEEASKQAQENVDLSPWSNRIEVVCQDFCTFETNRKFDLIVSNPPYFVNALHSPDEQRNMARHVGKLNYEQLFSRATLLLHQQGALALIIPAQVEKLVMDTAWKYGFSPQRILRVYSKPGKTCNRLLIIFSVTESLCVNEELCIRQKDDSYTSEYKEMTADFYLHF
ncbi:MAG: methyltransferase domain-containing protein [Mediterranea massiliensis]|nr:methyltransferase domain-containing protein [Mediterranea massiliensis]